MKTNKKLMPVKLLAVIIAFILAIGVLFGGALSVAAQEGHTHSFAASWTSGYKNHWHAATCGCTDLAADTAPHTFDGNTCSVCGAAKPTVDPAGCVHTFKTEWSSDADNHWHAATCGHNIVKDIAPHDFTNGNTCPVCGKSSSGTTTPVDPNPVDPNPVDPNPVDPNPVDPNPVNPVDPEEPKEPDEVPPEIDAAGGYNESLYAEWPAKGINGVKAYYKEEKAADWTRIDEQLIRHSNGTARVDAVGLKAGKYNLKITSEGSKDLEVKGIQVSAYDRSGYAHFKYTDGVGAYKDDGTLKDGALVIYVNDKNKNDLRGYTYKNGQPEDISKYFWTDLNNEKQYGIGYLLNNRQYRSNTEREQYGIQALSFAYGAVAIRFLGKVVAEDAEVASNPKDTLVLGLTAYDSTNFGGTVGDNGRMARMTNAKNLTVEGIGEDAEIWGWGFHFVSNDNLHKYAGSGKSFEARNLTFTSYPEDALGMEGTQGTANSEGSITSGASSASSKLCSPVERCWIHNNVFNPGGCENAAESDKKEGDGSCDIKRGQYFTVSYNYYHDCHKTNLVGSSDNSLTYNYSMHHNWWYNCWSRQPLLRRANMHYYNNYIEQDATANPKPKVGHVSSVRANAYMFAEANYYEGAKNVTLLASGGVVKAYGNVYYACYETNAATQVTSRDEYVSNSCKYIGENIDYSHFDTSAELFYLNNYYVQDAVSARKTVMSKAGVNGFGRSKYDMNKYTPSSAVQLNESGETPITIGTNSNGVVFNGVSDAGKFKGQGITFTLASEAQLTVTSDTAGDQAPELVRADGAVFASKFTGKITIVLPAGTYFIASGMKDKESVITQMSFADTGNSAAARVEAAKTAIEAIPATVTAEHADLVKTAQSAYSALTPSEKQSFDSTLKTKLDNAVTALNTALANNVVALINAIGTVNKDSFNKINAAQTAYDKLTVDQKALVANYKTLTDAQDAYAQFAVQNVIDVIGKLPDASEIGVTDKTAIEQARQAYDAAQSAYDMLDDGKDEGETNRQAQVTNYSKLENGLKTLDRLEKLFNFKDMLEGTSEETVTVASGAALKSAYEALNADQKAALTAAEKTAYDAIIKVYNDLASSSESLSFTSGTTGYQNSKFTVSGNTTSGGVAVGDVTYTSGLKMESSTAIKFNVSAKMTLTMYFGTACAGKKVKIDGTSYTVDSDGVITVQIEAGDHTITKDTTNTNLFYLTLTPAA